MKPGVTVEAGRSIWRSERGMIEVSTPAPAVIVYRCAGFMDHPLTQGFIEPMVRAARAQRRLDEFIDCAEVTGYDSELRIRLTEAIDSVRQYASIHEHVLVKSKLVAMGAWVVSLAIGGIDVYDDRRKFEQELARIVASR